MRYENRLPPEGINVTQGNPLLTALSLLAGLCITVVLVVLGIYLLGSALATQIPFSMEVTLAKRIGLLGEEHTSDTRSQALQTLANRLAAQVELPEGMAFSVRYVDDDEVNAYATLGGVIMLHRGLLDQLHSENAIALVLAHEMAHIIHRDPARVAGGRLLVSAALGLASAAIGVDLLSNFANMTGNLTVLSFSRDAERQADVTGVEMVGRAYGHMGGVAEVFERLAAYEAKTGLSLPEFLASHPETAGRNETLREQAQKMGIPLDGALTPVAPRLRSGQK